MFSYAHAHHATGFVNDHLNWRYAFYIQIPFIALAGILGCVMIDVGEEIQTL
jgi:hypothetical protein